MDTFSEDEITKALDNLDGLERVGVLLGNGVTAPTAAVSTVAIEAFTTRLGIRCSTLTSESHRSESALWLAREGLWENVRTALETFKKWVMWAWDKFLGLIDIAIHDYAKLVSDAQELTKRAASFKGRVPYIISFTLPKVYRGFGYEGDVDVKSVERILQGQSYITHRMMDDFIGISIDAMGQITSFNQKLLTDRASVEDLETLVDRINRRMDAVFDTAHTVPSATQIKKQLGPWVSGRGLEVTLSDDVGGVKIEPVRIKDVESLTVKECPALLQSEMVEICDYVIRLGKATQRAKTELGEIKRLRDAIYQVIDGHINIVKSKSSTPLTRDAQHQFSVLRSTMAVIYTAILQIIRVLPKLNVEAGECALEYVRHSMKCYPK